MNTPWKLRALIIAFSIALPAVAHAQPLVYTGFAPICPIARPPVPCTNPEIGLFDSATRTRLATIPFGGSSLAVSSDGSRLFVTHNGLTIVDTRTQSVIGTVTMSGADGVAVLPDGTRAYVSIPSGTLCRSSISTR